jgi:two-component system, sensor histidine kinase YesM
VRNVKAYHDWSIRAKLLLFTALFILLSVFAVSALSYMEYTKDSRQKAADQVQQTIDQVSININNYLDDLFRLALSPYRNETVMDALDTNVSGSQMKQLDKRRLIEDYLDEIMIYPRSDILRVFILADEVYFSGRFPLTLNTEEDFTQYDWYKEAMSTQEAIFVPAHRQQIVKYDQTEVFSVVKRLRSIRKTDRVLGLIKVDANYKGIANICSKVDVGLEGRFFIIDRQGKQIYADASHPDNGVFSEAIGERDKPFTMKNNGKMYLVNFANVPRTNWTIIAVNSMEELNANFVKTRNRAFLFAIACSLFAIVILTMFVRRFLRPLLHIVRLMKKVENGQLDVQFPYYRQDEIGYLGSSFNRLTRQINVMLAENTQLVKEVYESQMLQQEAQINALHSQIRPHFIFNSLNMIQILMQSGEQDKALLHLNQLSLLMRSMTAWDKELPLRRELELVQAYLSIQSTRYEGRLEYRIEVAESLLNASVPSLLFQPIIENAVIHGCEMKRGKTTIRLYTELTEENALFHIQDDGKGMNREQLAGLQARLDRGISDPSGGTSTKNLSTPGQPTGLPGTGIGLLNIDKRIKLKYGPLYGLRIRSEYNQGTTVTIVLPSDFA